jgi:ubiquinone/menaquinone biosynthesis C-methylase UbiE
MKQNKQAELESWVVKEAVASGQYEPFDDAFYKNFFELTVLKYLPSKGQKVLDVGCATGAVSRGLARLGFEVIGADISPELIEIAEKRAMQEGIAVTYLTEDAEKMSFLDNSFDAIIAFNLLHHFPHIDILAQELVRVCKPGGYIFTFDPNRLNPHAFLCQEQASPVRYDRFTINERALHPSELQCFKQKNIFVDFISVELKPSSKNRLYHKCYGFIKRSIHSPLKRITAFLLFNIAHFITQFLPEKFKSGIVMGIIQKDMK